MEGEGGRRGRWLQLMTNKPSKNKNIWKAGVDLVS